MLLTGFAGDEKVSFVFLIFLMLAAFDSTRFDFTSTDLKHPVLCCGIERTGGAREVHVRHS